MATELFKYEVIISYVTGIHEVHKVTAPNPIRALARAINRIPLSWCSDVSNISFKRDPKTGRVSTPVNPVLFEEVTESGENEIDKKRRERSREQCGRILRRLESRN